MRFLGRAFPPESKSKLRLIFSGNKKSDTTEQKTDWNAIALDFHSICSIVPKIRKAENQSKAMFYRSSSSDGVHAFSIDRTIFWSLAVECQKWNFASNRVALFVLRWPWTFLVVSGRVAFRHSFADSFPENNSTTIEKNIYRGSIAQKLAKSNFLRRFLLTDPSTRTETLGSFNCATQHFTSYWFVLTIVPFISQHESQFYA